jgi:hypothetical protein
MTTQDLFDLMFVIVVTAIVAFMIVTTWSLLGGLVAYIIAMLLGGSFLYVWNGGGDE